MNHQETDEANRGEDESTRAEDCWHHRISFDSNLICYPYEPISANSKYGAVEAMRRLKNLLLGPAEVANI